MIRTKAEYYRLAALGVLGNTVDRYYSLADWGRVRHLHELWGVQTTLKPGGPARLNCPTDEVEAAWVEFLPYAPVVSPMLSVSVPTIWAGDLWDSPTGLSAHGLYRPPLGFDWRHEMKFNQKDWFGVAANAILDLMDGNSRSDFEDLRDRYPGHVYECSIFEREVGRIPGRRVIWWEVRAY